MSAPSTIRRIDFRRNFAALTRCEPFPWQEDLFVRLLSGKMPKVCDIPTGLGKTSVIAVWLLAMGQRAAAGTAGDFPRRLVYVVNRRTVVDQATREVEYVREALHKKPELQPLADALRSLGAGISDTPLAISTLRGQFADNPAWRDDPARPAVIVGTVDMVGSRLLFSVYGCGSKSRRLHATFLGQDSNCWFTMRPTWHLHSRNSLPPSNWSNSDAASWGRMARRCSTAFRQFWLGVSCAADRLNRVRGPGGRTANGAAALKLRKKMNLLGTTNCSTRSFNSF